MKRTFGRFMSLLLVLAMVLAMIPAALAAYEVYSVAPGATIDLSSAATTASGVSALTWTCSDKNGTYLTVAAGNTGHATVTGVRASSSYFTVTATGKKDGYQTTIDTFTVYVQDAYSLTLTQSDSSSSYNPSTSLYEGDTRTLTATVTVSNAQKWNQDKVQVVFESDTDHAGFDLIPSANGKRARTKAVKLSATTSSNGYTTYTATATLTAVDAGYARVTAKVQYQKSDENWYDSASTYAQDKYILFNISGKTAIKVNLPANQTNFDLIVGGTNPMTGTLTPTVTGVTGEDAKLKYVYDSTHIYVDTTTGMGATIRPVSACAATKIYICLQKSNKDLTYGQIDQTNPSGTTTTGKVKIVGDYKVCTVSVRDSGMSVTAMDVVNSDMEQQSKLAEKTLFFGLQDPYKYNASKSYAVDMSSSGTAIITSAITGSITLEARITAPAALLASDKQTELDNAYSRIRWSSNAPTVVEVTGNGKTATLTPKSKGSAQITATVDNNVTATYSVEVYQGRAYLVTTAPSLGTTIGKASNSVLEDRFAQTKAVVEVQTSMYAGYKTSVELPVKNVRINKTGNTVKFNYDINGLKGNELYYDRANPNATTQYESGSYTISDISLDREPANASYKLTDTFANLVTEASTDSTDFGKDSFVWYMSSDQSSSGDTVIYRDTGANGKKSHTSTLTNLKQYITGTGTYVFRCRVTAGSSSVDTRTAIINVTGENHINIVFNPTTAKAGETFTITGTPQDYVNGTLTNVTGKTYTVTWSSSDESIVKLSSKTSTNSSPSITATAKTGGTVTIKAEATVGAKKYAAEKTFTVTVPTADTVRLTLGENDSYVLLDGSKIAAAVKDACKTTPSTFTFKAPANGTLYTTSSLSNTVGTSTKYSASEVSKMAYRPTRTTGTHEIEYAAYDGSAQIAAGKILVMTSANTVEYHIAANEKQQMVVSDFQSVYGSGLSSVTFGSNTDIRGGLYKGSTTSSGKVGSESYSVSSGTNLLKNVYFIAGTTVSKYSVTIPFTATGSSGTVNGQLVVYVNDTHTLNVTGATFRSLGIATELAPDNATGSTYITIDRVVGGKLYSSYTSIKSCTALTSKDLGSTKFYFTGSNSLDNLYVLPLADSKSVDITYTIDGSTKGTLTFKVNQQTSSNQFTDVTGNFKWAANSVDFMFMNGIINGNSTKNPKIFGPSAKMTRAMLVTVLYRAAGEPTVAGITNKFTDNKQGKYYYNAVLWASNLGIVNGATATTFDPDGNITREQIAAILYRYAGSPTVTGSLSGYADQAQVSSFAVTAMQWAVGSGIIAGTPNGGKTYLTAKGNATRAQVAVMLHRFLTFD